MFSSIAFVGILFYIALIDFKAQRIPDILTLSLYGLGVVSLFFNPSLYDKLLGGGVLFAFFLLLYLAKPQGVGFGDVKLAGAIGLFLGWKLALLALFLAFTSGGLVGAILILTKKKTLKDSLPFGPFLSGGAVIALFFGKQVLDWYVNLLYFP
ncbi:MAG: prepilin peptidase [Candidatus Atribacteria bacterium]|nr:prepilin peptidase [Candidatus Atribacteria bacterium]